MANFEVTYYYMYLLYEAQMFVSDTILFSVYLYVKKNMNVLLIFDLFLSKTFIEPNYF